MFLFKSLFESSFLDKVGKIKKKMEGFSSLPNEVLFHVVHFLDLKGLFSLMRVSKLFSRICDSERIWNHNCMSLFPYQSKSGIIRWKSWLKALLSDKKNFFIRNPLDTKLLVVGKTVLCIKKDENFLHVLCDKLIPWNKVSYFEMKVERLEKDALVGMGICAYPTKLHEGEFKFIGEILSHF